MRPRRPLLRGQAWAKVQEATQELQGQLRSLKFEDPSEGQEKVTKKVRRLLSPNSLPQKARCCLEFTC